MPIHDFATVQVYETVDLLEVVFPYDSDFVSFLKDLKGRWNGTRKCWQIKPTPPETPESVVEKIRLKLIELGPPQWDQIVKELKQIACVTKGYEIYPGPGGIRITLPPGHPSHYALKDVVGLVRNGDKWSVPSKLTSNTSVKQVLKRVLKEDKTKYEDWLEPSIDRVLIGTILMTPEYEPAYGLDETGGYVFVSKTFMQRADPGLSDTPIRDFAFILAKRDRKNDNELKVRLEYPDLEAGYDQLRKRIYSAITTKTIDAEMITGDWIQKRA